MIKVIHIKPFFKDARGVMTYLSDEKIPIVNVLLITSKKGAIRANHYHKKDSHYVYVLKGKMRYVIQDIDKKNKSESVILKTGDLVYTPSMLSHAMEFLQATTFLALTTEHRSKKSYEEDLVRVKLV